jgi:uroporphyrinogen decarboxylase
MTSRERVVAAIERKSADRVPIDLGGFNASTILAEAYQGLLAHLSIDRPVRIGDSSQFWVYVDEEIIERFNLDVVPCYPLYDGLGCRRDRVTKEWVHPRGTRVTISSDFSPKREQDGSYTYRAGEAVYRLPEDGFYFDLIKNPYSWVETPADVEKIQIPLMDRFELEYIEKTALQTRRETDKFVITEIFAGWCDIAGPWLGNAKFYMDLISNRKMIHALFEKMTGVWMKKIDQLVETIGDSADAVPVYNDLGTNMGGMYSSATVREMIIPYVRTFMDHVRKVSSYHIIFHACGSVYRYIADLIDAGIRILNPVQVGTRDMEPAKLKREFGKDVTFWGGAIDPQHVLPFASPREVKEQARRNIEVFKQGGGFVFNNPHNIQPHVPPENIVALYEAANEFGGY